MNFSLASVPSGAIFVFLTIVVLAVVGVIIFALHKYGTVNAEVSHGKTIFKLEAKDRK